MSLVNFDSMIPKNNKFILGCKEYIVPGKTNVRSALKIPILLQNVSTDCTEEKIEAVFVEMWKILGPHNPGRNYDEFSNSLTAEMLPTLTAMLLNQELPKQELPKQELPKQEEENGVKKNTGTQKEKTLK